MTSGVACGWWFAWVCGGALSAQDGESPGAVVTLQLAGPGAGKATCVFRSDVDGRAWSADAKPGGRVTSPSLPAHAGVELTVEAPGAAAWQRLVALEAGERLDLGEVTLRPEAKVRGRLVDSKGVPCAGRVRTDRGEIVEAGANGTFLVRGLRPGSMWLWGEADGFASIPWARVSLVEGETVAGVTVRMAQERVVSGVVNSADGPVVGAEVVATVLEASDCTVRGRPSRRLPWPERSTVTDVQGRWTLRGLPRGRVTYEARAPGHRPARQTTTAGVVSLAPTTIPAAFGEVVDRDGAPCVVRRVALLIAGESDGPWRRMPGDHHAWVRDDGFFQFVAKPGQLHRLVLDVEGHPRVLSGVLTDRDVAAGLRLEVEGGFVVFGHVVDELGRPVAGARVQGRELPSEENGLAVPLPLADVVTDADGAFASPPLVVGDYAWSVVDDCHRGEAVEVRVDEEFTSSLRLDVDTLGALIVDVGAFTEANEPWSVSLWSEGAKRAYATRAVGPEGEVRWVGVPETPFEVRLRRGVDRAPRVLVPKQGGEEPLEAVATWPPRPTVTVGAGSIQTLVLQPDPSSTASLRLQVTDGGKPRSAAEVTWVSGAVVRRGFTNVRGVCHWKGLTPGEGSLAVRLRDEEVLTWTRALTLEAGVTHEEVQVLRTVRVTGRLVDDDGEPRPAQSMRLESDVPGGGVFTFRTNAEGRFHLSQVPLGAARLVVADDAERSQELTVPMDSTTLDLGDVSLQ